MMHGPDCNPDRGRYSGSGVDRIKICECGAKEPAPEISERLAQKRLNRIRRKAPKFNVAEMDQAAKQVTEHYIPLVASIFRAFCAEDGISRPGAMELTIAWMHKPPYIYPTDEDERS